MGGTARIFALREQGVGEYRDYAESLVNILYRSGCCLRSPSGAVMGLTARYSRSPW